MDGSEGKGTCLQALRPGFPLWNIHFERTELTDYLLISHVCDSMYTHAYTHMLNKHRIINYEYKHV